MRFYTTDQISPNQALTREGFLVCKDVAIARCGEQAYLPQEILTEDGQIAIPGGPDGLVRVERLPEHVFHPDTIASFNGKPVTIDHPATDVTPANWRSLAVGIVQNVRQGDGTSHDLLLADLFITDAEAIAAVRDGLRQISCGYDAGYEQTGPGRAIQRNIIGNHAAILDRGRCGPRCAIADKESIMAKGKKWADKLMAQLKDLVPASSHDKLDNILKLRDDEGEGENLLSEIKSTLEDLSECVDDLKESHTRMDERMNDMAVKTGDAAIAKAIADAIPTAVADALRKARDEETAAEEEERKKKEAAEKKAKEDDDEKDTKDSAALLEQWMDTVGRAEIIAPGIHIPTKDSMPTVGKMRDSICALRRSALAKAWEGSHRDALTPFVGASPDFTKMTCDAAMTALVGSSEIVKRENNTKSQFAPTYDERNKTVASLISQTQAAARKMWPRP